MSEKKSKEKRHTLELPVYDLNAQLKEIEELCNAFEFDCARLVSYIFAEFLVNMRAVTEQTNASMAFMAFLQSAEKLGRQLRDERKNSEVKK